MSQIPRLYYAPDNASLCVRLALEALALPYATTLVDRSSSQHKTADYKKLNPNGRIPAFATPDGVLFETGAILLWLADRSSGKIFPATTDPRRGLALSWHLWLANTLHPCLLRMFYSDRYGEAKLVRAAAKEELNDLLGMLDERWAEAETTMTGCYLAPMLRWIAIYGGRPGWFNLATYPSLNDFAQAFEIRGFAIKAAELEGLGATPFSAPSLPNPPEGSVF